MLSAWDNHDLIYVKLIFNVRFTYMNLERRVDRARVERALGRAPIVLLTGPRQAGKTTMARSFLAPENPNYFDLENPNDRARITEPMLALGTLSGLVVIDEAQHQPDLFPSLRVLADRPDRPATFLVLGSASPDLIGLSAESLAGRVEILELGGLRLADVGADGLDALWQRGGLPRSYLADSEADSNVWRESYLRTFLERDLAQIGIRVAATTMRRFWTMVAHNHGQAWNGAPLAAALEVSQPTIRRYVDHLTDALVLRQLQPWFTNTAKRQVRSPKVYVRDTGLLHRLLDLPDQASLLSHPVLGASWEGFAIEQIAGMLDPAPVWYWGRQGGAEMDLVTQRSGQLAGFEIKRTAQPKMTKSIQSALTTLELSHVLIVHAGPHRFPVAENVTAVPLVELLQSDPAAWF